MGEKKPAVLMGKDSRRRKSKDCL